MKPPAHKTALHWKPAKESRVHCLLCPQRCRIADKSLGFCRARKNIGGTLYSLNYGRVSSMNLDPIEKKPLFHFFPGRPVLSIGSTGCNLACGFCQNWGISQEDASTHALKPEEAVNIATQSSDNLGLAYTYNEPFIWFEYILETARLARAQNLKNVIVTNGYIEEPPLREILPLIDAINVDVKSMRAAFYRELCQGPEGPARRTVEIARRSCHVEVTNLVIPGWNDTDEDFNNLARWLASLDPNIPLHFSRYHPAYKMAEPATPEATLMRARRIARQHLAFVYLGNIHSQNAEDTLCPHCKKVVIARAGFGLSENNLHRNACKFCGHSLPVINAD